MIKTNRPKYACRQCEQQDITAVIKTAPCQPHPSRKAWLRRACSVILLPVNISLDRLYIVKTPCLPILVSPLTVRPCRVG
ncbi:hypothetical protein [Shewanella sp. UCD-KL21]|uniref:hypothetical protein n=1 Tax=Shewanella sp. UCD-KL21 TaxID=1917164 RepID=UPI0034C67B44